ncbi:MAG: type IV secretory system conjugative DNA transfer family protein [Raoultibacter sp.]
MEKQTHLYVSKPILIALTIASGLLGYGFNRVAQILLSTKLGLFSLFLDPAAVFVATAASILANPFSIVLSDTPLLLSVIGVFGPWLGWLMVSQNRKRSYQFGTEHGSSVWADPAKMKNFADNEVPYNNIILSNTERLQLVPTSFNPEYDRNKNVLLIGGPGSGKTRFNVKPNLMQMNASYVITDPKCTLAPEVGQLFVGENGKWQVPDDCCYVDRKTEESKPYNLVMLNVKELTKSMHYNPFAYMRDGQSILKLVTVFVENTKGEGDKSGEDFWVKAEKLFYNALFAYIYYETNIEERNVSTLMEMIGMAEAREDDEAFKSALDFLFEDLETGKQWSDVQNDWIQVREPNPTHFAVLQYKKFKLAAGKTLKSILISCAARLAPFDLEDLRDLMSYDELELDKIGDVPTVFFMMMSDSDTTFNFVLAMCFYQLFDVLLDHADRDCPKGKLPVPVQCYFDEFANIGKIPNFEKTLTVIRSRNISCEIVLQSSGQLEASYDKAAKIIKDGCDTMVFLGGKSHETNEEISKMIGKATIASKNINISRGSQTSTSMSDQLIARDLIDAAEVGKMSRSECIVMIAGAEACKSPKYHLESHPRYAYIDPGHKGAAYKDDFDANAFIAAKAKKREVLKFPVEMIKDLNRVKTGTFFDINMKKNPIDGDFMPG